MDKAVPIAALVVLALMATIAIFALLRHKSRLRTAAALQEHERERLKAQIESLRASTAVPKTAAWNGYRRFRVLAKNRESDSIASFLLMPIDEKPLPAFLPGQFLTFELDTPGSSEPIVRCYSLSDSPNPNFYRVTIKRITPPRSDGPSGSNYFHDYVSAGSILKVRAPAGAFVLDPADDRPVVLLAGGVGLTPVLSMLLAICDQPAIQGRDVWFFYGVRDGSEQVMKRDLQDLAKANSWLKLHVCYSAPLMTDREGIDYHQKGRVTVELLKRLLPSSNYAYYICGPPPFMNSLITDLKAWGVPDKDVHYEAFGQQSSEEAGGATMRRMQVRSSKVKFARSGKEASHPSDKPLITVAKKCGAKITWGCCAGDCGMCKTLVQSGEVIYAKEPSFHREAGYCLPCVGIPKGDVVLEA